MSKASSTAAMLFGLLCLLGLFFMTKALADNSLDREADCESYAKRYGEIAAELDRRWQDARGLTNVEYIGFHIQTLTHSARELRALSVELGCDPGSFVAVYFDE